MNYLLDTHIFLWWIDDDDRLSPTARNLLRDGRNTLYWSSASSWEVAIKYKLGKLDLPTQPDRFLPLHLAANGIASLAIDDHHAFAAGGLPLHHRDPFDRLLVAQAVVANLTLVSADPLIKQYDVPLIS